MKKCRFLWSAHRITERQKAGKSRSIKGKQLKNSRNTVSKQPVALRSSANVNLERSDNERKQSFLEFVSKISKEFCPGSNCASGISSYLVRSLTVDSIILQTGHFGPCRRMTLTSKNQKQVTPRRRRRMTAILRNQKQVTSDVEEG